MPKPERFEIKSVYVQRKTMPLLEGPFDATMFPSVDAGDVVIYLGRLMRVVGRAAFKTLNREPMMAVDATVVFLEDVSFDITDRLFKDTHDTSNETVDVHKPRRDDHPIGCRCMRCNDCICSLCSPGDHREYCACLQCSGEEAHADSCPCPTCDEANSCSCSECVDGHA